MDRRTAIWTIGSLALYREFVRYNETIYVNKTIRSSDYAKFIVIGCTLKKGPLLPEGDIMVHLDTDDYTFSNNTIWAA